MADQHGPSSFEPVTKLDKVFRQQRPAKTALMRVGLAVVTVVRRNNLEFPRKFPRDGMPHPGQETRGVEHYYGRSGAIVKKVLNFSVSDVLRADFRIFHFHDFLSSFKNHRSFIASQFFEILVVHYGEYSQIHLYDSRDKYFRIHSRIPISRWANIFL
jgi:hypothetical protein